jgi:hypothetical protein
MAIDLPPTLPPSTHFEVPGTGAPALAPEVGAKLRATIDPTSIPLAQRGEQMRAMGYSPEQIAAATQTKTSTVDKLRTKLSELLLDQAQNRPLSVKVANVNIGEHAGVALGLNLEWIANDHPRVANDPDRRAFNEKQDQPPVWMAAGGVIAPRVGASAQVGNVSLGFSADAELSYTLIKPYKAELNEAKRLATDASVDLPTTLAAMRKAPAGTELVIMGRGRLAASAGVGVGQTLASGRGFAVGASASASVGVSEEQLLMLRLKTKANGDVYAQLSAVDTERVSTTLSAFLGVDSRLGEFLPGGGGGLAGRAASAVDRKIENFAKLEAQMTWSATEVASDRGAFTFATPGRDAEDAFRALFRFDPSLATSDDAKFAGIKRARFETENQVKEVRIGAEAGPLQIISAGRRLDQGTGVLTRVDEAGNKTQIKFSSVDLDADYVGIISKFFIGAQKVSRSFVTFQEGEGPVQRYYHLRYEVKDDGKTSNGDLRSAVAIARMLGAIDPEAEVKLADPATKEMFKGKTTRILEVSISHDGIAKLAEASGEARRAAHAAAFALDRGLLIAPWMDKEMKDYNYWLGAIYHGPQTVQDMGRTNDASDFWRQTGVDLRVAHEGYWEGIHFDQLIEGMKGKTPDEQAALMKERAHQFRLNPFGTLGTAALIAGPEHVLVHEARIKSDKGELSLKSEGVAVDPRSAAERALENP